MIPALNHYRTTTDTIVGSFPTVISARATLAGIRGAMWMYRMQSHPACDRSSAWDGIVLSDRATVQNLLTILLRGRTHLRAAIVDEPSPCSILIMRVLEVLHLRVDEVGCNEWHDRCEATVRDDCDLLDVPVLLLDDLQPREQRAQVIPSPQCRFVNQYSAQRAPLLLAGTDLVGQCRVGSRCKRPFGLEHNYRFVPSQFVIEH